MNAEKRQPKIRTQHGREKTTKELHNLNLFEKTHKGF